MSAMPLCPNCGREQEIKGENQNYWAFRCRWCHTTRIVSKPTLRGASRLEVELARRARWQEAQRRLESLPAYSIPKELNR